MKSSKRKVLLGVSVILCLMLLGVALESYNYLRHEYHTETLSVELEWTDESLGYGDDIARPVIFWQGLRGDVVPSDYITVRPDGIRHKSKLYHRNIWIDSQAISRISKVTVCVGDRCQELAPEDLSTRSIHELSVDSSRIAKVSAVKLPVGALSLGSTIPHFDAIVNWHGDLRFLFTVAGFFAVMLLRLLALALLVVFVFRFQPQTSSSCQLSFSPRYLWVGLALVFLVALVVRLVGLGNIDPHIDEYAHVSAGLELLNGTWPDYTRGIVVSLSVAAAYSLFGASSLGELITIGAVPGVLVSSFTVLPLYALGRRITPIVGLIAAALWAISPWAIGMAHSMREYAYFPFLVLAFLVAIVRIFDILFSDARVRIIPFIFWLLVFFGYVWYAFLIDTRSTARVGFLFAALTVIGLVIAHRHTIYLQFMQRPKLIVAVIIPVIVLAYIVWNYATGQRQLTLLPDGADWRWFNDVLRRSQPLQWWSGASTFFWPAVFVLVPYVVITWRRRTPYLLTWLIVFAGVLFFYIFFFDRYYNARYIFYILPFVCLLFAVVLDALWNFVVEQRRRWLRQALLACAVMFTLQVVNPMNTWTAMTSTEHGTTFTDNFQPRVRGVVCLLRDRVSDGTTIIQSHLSIPLRVTAIDQSASIHGYSMHSDERFDEVASLIAQNPDQGFMILDVKRGGGWAEGFPTGRDFELAGVEIQTLGQLDQFHVYAWGHHEESRAELQAAMRACAVNFESPR